MDEIRNFVIVAHIDHGKSTLADRFLELTGTVEKRKMREQFLDQMDLEREKGITIKMQPVRMMYHPDGSYQLPASSHQQSGSRKLEAGSWQYQSSSEYILNLIDTPGHVDFYYEVSRALAAVEGAILLVDATQGMQAQTIANLNLAREEGLAIIPVINKIDLPGARIRECEEELANVLGCRAEDILKISAKSGEGVEGVLEEVVRRVPPPNVMKFKYLNTESSGAARALIFDSHFDSFRGVVAHVRVFEGSFLDTDKVTMLATGADTEIMELGYFLPALVQAKSLKAGEIGYIATGLKEPEAIRVGDTIAKLKVQSSNVKTDGAEPLPGYREPKPVVFASIYPEDADDYTKLRDALRKIKLNDASIFFEPESSDALGRGFRAGFLGLLHMEIAGERLSREYKLELIFTTPSVAYQILFKNGKEEYIYSPSRLPDGSETVGIKEPWVRLEVITPQKFLGGVMSLLSSSRGSFVAEDYLGRDRLMITYEMPLKDILVDFFDDLKSVTEGYGSFSYELLGYRKSDLGRLDILIAGEREEALSQVVPEDMTYDEARKTVQKLKELLPKQLFAVSIQAAASGRVIARETIPALKKDVTGYLYGGDRTRKMKLWKKQQRGKKRLEKAGRVKIPPDVFLKLLKK